MPEPVTPAKRIELDASRWSSRDDFYKDFLAGLGAPDWHGHNLDALWDSVRGGSINQIAPPFYVEIAGTLPLPHELRDYLRKVEALFDEAKAEGVNIGIRFHPPL